MNQLNAMLSFPARVTMSFTFLYSALASFAQEMLLRLRNSIERSIVRGVSYRPLPEQDDTSIDGHAVLLALR